MQPDPHWPNASDWLSGFGDTRLPNIAIFGVPLHLAALSPGRCDLAPAAIREALQRESVYDFEYDRDLRVLACRDYGDLPIASLTPEQGFEPIVQAIGNAARSPFEAIILLGGDNSITRPAYHALAGHSPRTALLTIDAHLDIRHLNYGMTNGNPIRALLADGVTGSSIIQIGIQPFSNSKEYADLARESGIRSISLMEARARGIAETVTEALRELGQVADSIYVDTDLDVLDRALAPGCSGARPGGFTMNELRQALMACGAHHKVRMIDFVELSPDRDIAGISAYAGAIAVLSFASGLTVRDR